MRDNRFRYFVQRIINVLLFLHPLVLRVDRVRRRPRVFPQLDGQPRDLPRLVPGTSCSMHPFRPSNIPFASYLKEKCALYFLRWQLTLKEGLTVYRDQEFSGDMMNSHAVKRIEDVNALRARQFAEDAGPMSHPIRPESYISMDNFYT